MVLARLKDSYIKSAYYSICDDYHVNSYEIWMNGDSLYTTEYDLFGDGWKAAQRSPPDNLTLQIIAQSKGFTWKGIENVSRSVRAYVYFVLNSHVQARSSTLGNLASARNAQQVFKSTFNALMNEDY